MPTSELIRYLDKRRYPQLYIKRVLGIPVSSELSDTLLTVYGLIQRAAASGADTFIAAPTFVEWKRGETRLGIYPDEMSRPFVEGYIDTLRFILERDKTIQMFLRVEDSPPDELVCRLLRE